MYVKESLRREIISRRRSIQDEEVKSASSAIMRKIMASDIYKRSQNILIYYSFDNEAGTHELIKAALNDGKDVALPRVTGPRSMKFLHIDSLSGLEKSRFGIMEPPALSGEEMGSGLVIAPGIAFDRDMNRLGYGGGYYDTWFQIHSKNIYKCAIAYDFQILDKVPHEEHDIKMDMIITPSGEYTGTCVTDHLPLLVR